MRSVRFAWICVSALGMSTATAQLLVPMSPTVAVPRYQGTSYVGLEVGDVNNDHHLDAVVVDQAGRIYTMLGDGLGGFTGPFVAAGALSNSCQPRLLDIDADGDLDLLVGGMIWTTNPSRIEVFLGDGTGQFVATTQILDLGRYYSIGDFDGDQRPDVVGELAGAGKIGIAYGGGPGIYATTQGSPLPAFTVPGSTLLSYWLAGQLDGTGPPDLLTVRFLLQATPVTIDRAVLLGRGPGQLPMGSIVPLWQLLFPIALADFDGDRVFDVLSQNGAGQPGVGINNGRGDIVRQQNVSDPAPLWAVRAGDIDTDGRTDIVALGTNAILVHLGDGTGGFAPALVLPMPPSVWSPETANIGAPEQVAIGDFDEDGWPDVLVAGLSPWGGGYLQVLHNTMPTPAGIAQYGTGTPTCTGAICMSASAKPSIGNRHFRVQCTNAPPDATGSLWMGSQNVGGWVVTTLNVRLHIDAPVFVAEMFSGAAGIGHADLPLPRIPALVGSDFYLQSVWTGNASMGDTCSVGVGELATSRGLKVTLQP